MLDAVMICITIFEFKRNYKNAFFLNLLFQKEHYNYDYNYNHKIYKILDISKWFWINTFSTISQLWLCMTTTFIIIYRLTFRNAFWYSIVRLKFVFKSLKSVFKSATTHWLEQKQSNIHDINYIKWSSKLPA